VRIGSVTTGEPGSGVDPQDEALGPGVPLDWNGDLAAGDLDAEAFRAALESESHGGIIAQAAGRG
jgi:hypothetical protein